MPRPDTGILTHARLRALADSGAKEGFHRSPGRRDLLLADIGAAVRLALPESEYPRDQVLSDLIQLNFQADLLHKYLTVATWLVQQPQWVDAHDDVELHLTRHPAAEPHGMATGTPPADRERVARGPQQLLDWLGGGLDLLQTIWRKGQASGSHRQAWTARQRPRTKKRGREE